MHLKWEPNFLILSGWNQLELPKGTCRKIEGEIWFATCNVAVWFHLELGVGQKRRPQGPQVYSKHFSRFFLGAGYPDVDPSPSSKTTVSIFFFFSAGSPGWNPTTWSTWKWTFGSQLWQRGNYNLSMYCIDIQELVCIVLIVNPASPEWLS